MTTAENPPVVDTAPKAKKPAAPKKAPVKKTPVAVKKVAVPKEEAPKDDFEDRLHQIADQARTNGLSMMRDMTQAFTSRAERFLANLEDAHNQPKKKR